MLISSANMWDADQKWLLADKIKENRRQMRTIHTKEGIDMNDRICRREERKKWDEKNRHMKQVYPPFAFLVPSLSLLFIVSLSSLCAFFFSFLSYYSCIAPTVPSAILFLVDSEGKVQEIYIFSFSLSCRPILCSVFKKAIYRYCFLTGHC